MKIPAFNEGGPRFIQPPRQVYKAQAQAIGCPLDEYVTRREAGDRYCRTCKTWKRGGTAFNVGRTKCRDCDKQSTR